ncbi:197_t:CDS:2, partial [Racocetra persica]
ELIKWLTKPEIKSNKKIRLRFIPKTEKKWFNLMKSKDNEPNDPEPQVYHFLDLDIEVSWPILFSENEEYHEITFKIIDKYEPIRESKKAREKYIRGGPNIIFTKKIKPGFWIGIDEKFLVREVSKQSEEAINNALQGSQAIWLIGIESENQRIFQFVLKDESLKVVDLVEQVFGANHIRSQLANEINKWHPISGKINNIIKQACIEHSIVDAKIYPFYKSDSCQKQLNQQEEQENKHWESIKDILDSTALSIYDPIMQYRNLYLNGEGGFGKMIQAIKIFKDINIVVFTHTNILAKDFQNDRKNGVEEWTPECMGEKKFLQVVIWDEVYIVPKHILEKFIDYLLEQKYQIICCSDDTQPLPFFGEMPHSWLKKQADYYEEVLTDYQAKCPKLCELKKRIYHKNN